MDGREFLDSIIKSGEEVFITLKPTSIGEIRVVRGTIIWSDEDTIGIKFVIEEKDGTYDSSLSALPVVNIRKKIVLCYKSAIENIDGGWEKVVKEEELF